MSAKRMTPRKVMVIEDNKVNQRIAKMITEQIGHKCIQVLDGTKAVEACKADKPDLIILDIQLGDVSGIDVAKDIRKLDDLKEVPIIVVTSMDAEEEKKQIIKESGCNHYIAKPFMPNHFVEAIAKFIPVLKVDWVMPEPEDEQ